MYNRKIKFATKKKPTNLIDNLGEFLQLFGANVRTVREAEVHEQPLALEEIEKTFISLTQ